jgi:hypothetical protein
VAASRSRSAQVRVLAAVAAESVVAAGLRGEPRGLDRAVALGSEAVQVALEVQASTVRADPRGDVAGDDAAVPRDASQPPGSNAWISRQAAASGSQTTRESNRETAPLSSRRHGIDESTATTGTRGFEEPAGGARFGRRPRD